MNLAVQITARLVLLRLLALAIEELERGEALDAESLSEVSLRVGVDLCNLDLVLGMLKHLGQLLVHGSKVLAVAAPGGKELDKRGLSGKDKLVKVGRNQVDDGRLGSHRAGQDGEHEALDQDHDVLG
ncbi:LOW QUALITY PROTEIN: hypothetical protein MKX07_000797 [Trichoderma sp. CBMAI-0711]|nr:LOW QUALITY PROTEIN: hypothetical protein MKX07_000797 [Trichoderma sp. CBMAI-0711]